VGLERGTLSLVSTTQELIESPRPYSLFSSQVEFNETPEEKTGSVKCPNDRSS
jgi:hypothetical protein